VDVDNERSGGEGSHFYQPYIGVDVVASSIDSFQGLCLSKVGEEWKKGKEGEYTHSHLHMHMHMHMHIYVRAHLCIPVLSPLSHPHICSPIHSLAHSHI